MKEFWDERYSQAGYAYGEQPNVYLKEKLIGMPAGKILFPAEGEGRNAVFAASMGWLVSAFDLSQEGKRKALLLAAKHKVELNYEVGLTDQEVELAEGLYHNGTAHVVRFTGRKP